MNLRYEATWLRMYTVGRRLTSANWLATQVGDAALSFTSAISESDFSRVRRLVRGHTMMGITALAALYEAVRDVIAAGVPGDLVECGVARGGSAALMALAARGADPERASWLFDTFEGLPAPSRADPDYALARRYIGRCRGEIAEVQQLFTRLGVDRGIRFIKGRFEETVPASPVGTIAVLHLDGDWHDSVRVCLDHLYDRVAPGGVIQIDDYGHWEGARKAVDEFLEQRAITEPLHYIDYAARQLWKPPV